MKKLVLLISFTCSMAAMAQAQKPVVGCEVIKVNACPRGTYSYSCNGRYLYQVSCSIVAHPTDEESAQKLRDEMEQNLSSRWGY